MKVLFIIDPLPTLAVYKDTSVSMMQALVAKNHTISVAQASDMYIDNGAVMVSAIDIELADNVITAGKNWWQQGDSYEVALNHFGAVLMRKDPPFDMEYFYATHLFDHAQAQGALVFNTGDALRNHPEKLAITEFPQYTAPTIVTSSMARIRAFHAEHKDIIVKPLDGMGGEGIFRIQESDPNLGSILETLTNNERTTIMAQRYIPDIVNGDKRILIIGGQAIPYSLARIPLAGETRGNIAAGGRGVAQPLTERDLEIANAVGAKLNDRGLLLIGLDVIGDYITEINVTSPTCFVEITEQTDYNVAARYVEALEQAVAKAHG